LAGVRQLINRLRCEEGGGHGMVVADSDVERWARTGADDYSGGAALESSGRTTAQGGVVAPEKGIRGRGCGGRLGVWSQRGATRRQGAGRGPGRQL
jgi:hypothetical protein